MAAPYQRLTSDDLKHCDDLAKKLTLTAMEAGCTGKVSHRGHIIIRNADGQTCAIAPKLTTHNRSAQNARADIQRLLAHGTDKAVETASEALSEPLEVTVAQAFVHPLIGAQFSAWYDTLPEPLPAHERVVAAPDGAQNISFLPVTDMKGESPMTETPSRQNCQQSAEEAVHDLHTALDRTFADLTERITALESELARQTQRADDATARLAMIRETLET